jgi:exonuclease III
MILISWNSEGLGSTPKVVTVKDLIRLEKPMILLIQENKMKSSKANEL